jgi:2-keto-4-pentenoate hydratase/2-oxohepta-3-ene-1,7-dioic acid hydratase in catechol pathway
MRWVTYRSGDHERAGLLEDGVIYGLEPGVQVIDLLGDDGARLRDAGERARRSPAEERGVGEVQLCAPIPRPPTIRDFSSFEEHIRNGLEAIGQEMGEAWYENPVFYFGNANSVIGPGDIVAPGNTERLDYELEVAAVIGRGGINLDPATAEEHIAGFCIFNDWSARDLQAKETATVPIGPAKGKDFANGFGPCLVTRDEIEPHRKAKAFDLTMTARVNGEVLSRGNLADIYWSFGEMVSYASRQAPIRPGDLVGSGTCGSGCILELSLRPGGPPYLQPGDTVELEVEALGTLANTVAFGPVPAPLR